MLDGVTTTVIPPGEESPESTTGLEKPCRSVMKIVEVPGELARMTRLEGFAVMEKSLKRHVIIRE